MNISNASDTMAKRRGIRDTSGGRIALLNREDGGLCVSLVLPA